MSRYFVTDPPVAIPEFEAGSIIDADGQPRRPNVIFIRPRMDVETRGKVSSELVKLGDDGKTAEFNLGANQTALLIHNIVTWEGPDLSSVPCTPEHIRTLDPNEPHIARVIDEIGRRNAPRESPNPKAPGASGSMSATELKLNGSQAPADRPSVSELLATSIPK